MHAKAVEQTPQAISERLPATAAARIDAKIRPDSIEFVRHELGYASVVFLGNHDQACPVGNRRKHAADRLGDNVV